MEEVLRVVAALDLDEPLEGRARVGLAEDHKKFHRWSRRLVSVSSGRDMLRFLPAALSFMRYLRKLVERRRADPRDDLITALIRAEEAGDKLSEDELLAMVFLLLVAGHETTVNLISAGTLALLEHPEQTERLGRDPSLAKPAVEELLRYTSPVEMATERYPREDVEIVGTRVPRGELVLAVLGSANRDEERFEDPNALDIARDPNRHLAFGRGGMHHCLGAPLARMEGQIALNALLRRFPSAHLAAAPETLRWQRGLFLRGLERLPLVLQVTRPQRSSHIPGGTDMRNATLARSGRLGANTRERIVVVRPTGVPATFSVRS